MKKIGKKGLSVLLALILVISLIPTAAFATETGEQDSMNSVTSEVRSEPEVTTGDDATPDPEVTPGPEGTPDPEPSPSADPSPDFGETEAVVSTWSELNAAISNTNISSIKIASDIELEDSLTINRDVEFISGDSTETYKLFSASNTRHIILTASSSETNTVNLNFSGIELNSIKNGAGGIKSIGNVKVIIDNLVLKGFSDFLDADDTYQKYAVDIAELTMNNSQAIELGSDGIYLSSGSLNNCKIAKNSSLYGYYTGVVAFSATISECVVSGFSYGIKACGYSSSPTNIVNTEIANCTNGLDLSATVGVVNEPNDYANLENCDIHDCANGVYINVSYNPSSSMFNKTTAKISNSRIYDCGDGVDATGGIVNLTNTDVYDNRAYGIDKSYSVLYVNGGKIYNNVSGGVISYNHGNTRLTNCELYGNGNLEGNGAVTVHSSNGYDAELTECLLHDNIARNGGALYMSAGPAAADAIITDCEIYNNTANVNGGAICAEQTVGVNCSGTTFRDNLAKEYGGGLYVSGKDSLCITNSTISGNQAMKGGGIYSYANPSKLENTLIQSNKALYYGGGIYCGDLAGLSSDAQTRFTGNEIVDGSNYIASDSVAASYPNILFAGVSDGSHPFNNADINFTTEEKEIQIIRTITQPSPIYVLYQTPADNLELPQIIEVAVDGSVSWADTEEFEVLWDTTGYTNDYYAGTQIIQGSLVLPSGIANPDEITPKISVIVSAPHIVSCGALEPIEVEYGTEIWTVFGQLQEHYPSVSVTLVNGKTATASLYWNNYEANFSYDPSTSGTYQIKGNLYSDLTAGFSNATNYYATVEVKVGARPPEIVSVASLEKLSFPRDNASPESLLEHLEQYRAAVDVTYDNNVVEPRPILWDTSNFDGATPGDYTIYGNIDLSGTKYLNTHNIRAEILITVDDTPREKIKSIPSVSITVPQNIYLSTMDKENDFGTATLAEIPEQVTVEYRTERTAQKSVVWDTESYDPGKTGEQIVYGTVSLDENTENPGDLKAELHIQVEEVTYEVMFASPTEIPIEVYPNTSIEEINNKLREEEQSCLSLEVIDADGWDVLTFYEFALSEADNPQWEEQKGVPGTYSLSVSLPDNMIPLADDLPGPITVQVTVLEPLEITSVSNVTMDAYQSADFEDLPNIPTTVEAILENGESLPIEVQWAPSGYSKDTLGQQIIVGDLVNLPNKVKQPETGEMKGTLIADVNPVNYEVVGVIDTDAAYSADAGLTLDEITEMLKPKTTLRIASTTDGVDFTTEYEAGVLFEQEKNGEFNSEYAGTYTLKETLLIPENIICPADQRFDEVTLRTNQVEVLSVETPGILAKEGTAFADIEKPETVLATLSCTGPDGKNKLVFLDVDWGTGTGYTPFPEDLTDNNSVVLSVKGQIVNCPQYISAAGMEAPLFITLSREFTIKSISPSRVPETAEIEVKLGTSLEDVYTMLDSHTAHLELQSTSGALEQAEVTFTLRKDDNMGYDPLTVGTYMLTGYFSTEDNIKNPDGLKIQIAVKTMKYTISSAKVLRLGGIVSGTAYEELPLPELAAIQRNDGQSEDIPVTWNGSTYIPTKVGSQVIRGTLNTPLPVYLENPSNRQPTIIVTTVSPNVKILSLEQITGQPQTRSRLISSEHQVPGYVEYQYRAELLHEDGTTTEEIISIFTEIE